MKHKWFVAAGLGVSAVLVAGFTATFVLVRWAAESDDGLARTYEEHEFETLDDWPGAAEFSEQFDLVWPDSAVDLRLSSDGFMDPLYEFRLTVSPEDLEDFTASPGCQGLLPQSESSNKLGVIVRERDWWVPEKAQVFQSCQIADDLSLGRSQSIVVDRSNPEQYLLYVAVYYI